VTARSEVNRKLVLDFCSLAFVEGRHREAAERFLGERYIQHNPFVADGVEGFVQFFESWEANKRPDFRHRILRVIADEDYVAVHATIHEGDGHAGSVLCDIFRIEDDRIVEHWDAFKPLADPATIPHGNGETETIATDAVSDRESNRRNVVLFYDKAFVQKRYIEAADEFFGERYIQHNSFVADGIEAYKRHFGESALHPLQLQPDTRPLHRRRRPRSRAGPLAQGPQRHRGAGLRHRRHLPLRPGKDRRALGRGDARPRS